MISFRNITIFCLTFFSSFLLIFCYGEHITEQKKEISSSSLNRLGKNLFPFVWVSFQSAPCGQSNEGVCVQRGKCAKRGGTASGTCRDSFGECCIFTAKCNETRPVVDVDQLVTSLETPVPSTSQCTFRFKKEPNICQIRLDFSDVRMASASDDGVCSTDRLRVSGSVTVDNDFTTCGTLTGQHMYLTFGSQETIEVTPLIKAMSSTYKILATRIHCDSVNRAPDYCLQYFRDPSGSVRSFDWGKQQQNNQQYTACVKPLPQSTSVRWSTCSGVTPATDAFDIVSALGPPAGTGPCMTDWIQLKGQDKMCWEFLNVTTNWKPYEVSVYFDGEEFPPPLPAFNVPVDPSNCTPMTCVVPAGLMDAVTSCDCIGMAPAQSCQCTIDGATPLGMALAPQAADFKNKGFCLEYTQL